MNERMGNNGMNYQIEGRKGDVKDMFHLSLVNLMPGLLATRRCGCWAKGCKKSQAQDTASNKKRRIIDVVRLVELLKVILNNWC